MNLRHKAERAWEKHLKKHRVILKAMSGEAYAATKLCFKLHWVCDDAEKTIEDLRFRLKHAKKLLGY